MAYYEAPTSWELAKSRNVLTLPTAAATFEIIIIVVVDCQDIVKVLKNHLHDSNLARVAHHCARLLDSLPDIGKVEK